MIAAEWVLVNKSLIGNFVKIEDRPAAVTLACCFNRNSSASYCATVPTSILGWEGRMKGGKSEDLPV